MSVFASGDSLTPSTLNRILASAVSTGGFSTNTLVAESGNTILAQSVISATTLAGTILTASQLNVTTAAALATIGTVGTGVWQGTVVAAAYGGTGLTSYAIGDLLYASAATTLARLADVVAGSVLVSGGVGVAPAWSATPTVTTLTATNLGGTLTTVSQPNVTTMAGLTTVGALNAGSITSGFGAIDIGADALTCGAITASGIVRVNLADNNNFLLGYGSGGTRLNVNLNVDNSGRGNLILYTAAGVVDIVLGAGQANSFALNAVSMGALSATTGAFSGLLTANAGISVPTGFNVTGAGTAQVTGFATVSATTLTGTLSTAAQPNVTSLGTLLKTTFTPAANAEAIVVSGYSLTGANAQSLLDLAGTWNTSGTPTAIKLVVTDTASNAASLLMDLWAGGSSKFSVDKTGAVTSLGLTITSGGYAVVGNSSVTGILTVDSLVISSGGTVITMNDSNFLMSVTGAALTLSGIGTAQLILDQPSTAGAPLRIPHGAAPTTPVNGDIWTTTAGLYVRINGGTVGPLA